MNYNSCNGWNECAGTYEGAYYTGNAAFAKTAAAGGNCGSITAIATAGTTGSCGGAGRTCDLYWQSYMAKFYTNNRRNRSVEARTAAQAADRTAAVSDYRCPYNNRNNCGSWDNCGNCGNRRS